MYVSTKAVNVFGLNVGNMNSNINSLGATHSSIRTSHSTSLSMVELAVRLFPSLKVTSIALEFQNVQEKLVAMPKQLD